MTQIPTWQCCMGKRKMHLIYPPRDPAAIYRHTLCGQTVFLEPDGRQFAKCETCKRRELPHNGSGEPK